MSEPLLSAHGLTKRFPGVTALREVSFDLRPGEIHALCGENGAGKSTLIKLLSGIHPHGSYEGELRIDGQPARFRSTEEATAAGVAVIYQELALVEDMTVAENIFLGNEPRRGWLIDRRRMLRQTRELLAQFQLDLDPDARCGQLGIGQKQLVEIVKALSKNSRILILDEPTAALSQHEVNVLLEILRVLRRRGISCIYISHKLEEVFALSDRISVLRDGQTIATHDTAATQPREIIREMVGREIAELFPQRPPLPGAASPVLEVRGLSVNEARTGQPRLHEISFQVAPGEVLGIGGLMGAGRTELLMHLFGVWGTRTAGRVMLKGEPLDAARPAEILRRGLALISEDRRRYGLILDETIGFNLSLSHLRALRRGALIDARREHLANERQFQSLRIKAPHLATRTGTLSGGNQQKVVLGKVLMTDPAVVLLDEPTRGIDIGAKREIYELIAALNAQGRAVVLVSSELPELLGLSDRILMLRAGRIGGIFSRAEATPEILLAAALGDPVSATPPDSFP